LYLCVPVHELVPQDVLTSTNNIANDDDLDVSMSVNKIANDDDQGNRFKSISICSDQLVDEEESPEFSYSSVYRSRLTRIRLFSRSPFQIYMSLFQIYGFLFQKYRSLFQIYS